jgi:hypothetical protein
MYDQNTTVIPAQDPAAGYAPAPSPYGAPAPKRRNTGAFVGLGAVIALILLAGGLALFGPMRSVSTTEASATSGLPSSRSAQDAVDISQIPSSIEVPEADEAPALPTVDEVPSDAPVSTPANGGGSSSNGGGAPAPQPPAPSAPAPVITSFTTPEDIDCHNGDFQTFTASWATTNAVKVSISIDGPGVYKYYGPTGSDSLPFTCSSPHTFLLTAYGHDGSTVTKSITLHPRNVQTPDMGDDDEDQGNQGGQGSDQDSDDQGPSTPDDEI